MKALSIRQPWAWLIVNGHKDVENRTWPTHFRGRFLVHAGRRFDAQGYRRVRERMGVAMPEPEAFELGGIVGEAELVDCVQSSDSPWFSGPHGFVLRHRRPLRFQALRGRQGFFDVEWTEDEQPVGTVESYDPARRAMVVRLVAELAVGDLVRVRQPESGNLRLEQTVEAIDLDGREVGRAGASDVVRIPVLKAVERGDEVFKVVRGEERPAQPPTTAPPPTNAPLTTTRPPGTTPPPTTTSTPRTTTTPSPSATTTTPSPSTTPSPTTTRPPRTTAPPTTTRPPSTTTTKPPSPTTTKPPSPTTPPPHDGPPDLPPIDDFPVDDDDDDDGPPGGGIGG